MIVEANLGSPVVLLILAGIILVVFGGKKLPELGKGFGQGLKEFKDAMREENPGKEKDKEKPRDS